MPFLEIEKVNMLSVSTNSGEFVSNGKMVMHIMLKLQIITEVCI